MIQVRTTNGEIKFLSSYNEVRDYINRIERRKASKSGNIEWHFIRRRYETLASLYYRTPPLDKGFFTKKEKEAVEQELGLIEILKGSMEDFTQILSRSNLDIEPLMKSWCYDYCKKNGLEICELVKQQ